MVLWVSIITAYSLSFSKYIGYWNLNLVGTNALSEVATPILTAGFVILRTALALAIWVPLPTINTLGAVVYSLPPKVGVISYTFWSVIWGIAVEVIPPGNWGDSIVTVVDPGYPSPISSTKISETYPESRTICILTMSSPDLELLATVKEVITSGSPAMKSSLLWSPRIKV